MSASRLSRLIQNQVGLEDASETTPSVNTDPQPTDTVVAVVEPDAVVTQPPAVDDNGEQVDPIIAQHLDAVEEVAEVAVVFDELKTAAGQTSELDPASTDIARQTIQYADSRAGIDSTDLDLVVPASQPTEGATLEQFCEERVAVLEQTRGKLQVRIDARTDELERKQ